MRYFLLVAFLLQLFGCIKDASETSEFVRLEGKEFYQKDEPFYPLILNYVVGFYYVEGHFVLGPSMDYDIPNKIEWDTKDSMLSHMNAHFQMIKDMGFNTVRIMDLHKLNYHKFHPSAALLYHVGDTSHYFKLDKEVNDFRSALKDLGTVAKKHELKLLITLPRPREQDVFNRTRRRFIKEILVAYKNEPTVFAYDFFNEPLYFDNAEFLEDNSPTAYSNILRTKLEAKRLSTEWDKLMQAYAPNQLSTLSLAEPIEVLEWDASLMDVDFISIHTYNPLRVPNEIYWYGKYLDKPWIVSETALPADNDSIRYDLMTEFMRASYQSAINCGASGYGWWQYQETFWGHSEFNFTGLIAINGINKNTKGQRIIGTPKPAANSFRRIVEETKKEECKCAVNYQNMLGYSNYLHLGKVVDKESGDPIKGAVVRGYLKDWSNGINTYTDGNGDFELYSNDTLLHFEVSAFGKEKFGQSYNIQYLIADTQKEINDKVRKLSYEQISFLDFYDDKSQSEIISTNSIFNFNKSAFQQYVFKALVPVIELEKTEVENE
ncbi:MAG: hypothetical protein RIC95_01645 [Vicingaceae bacterium]